MTKLGLAQECNISKVKKKKLMVVTLDAGKASNKIQ